METTYTESEVRKMLERLQTLATVNRNHAHKRYSEAHTSYRQGVAEGESIAYDNMKYAVETELIALRQARPITVGK